MGRDMEWGKEWGWRGADRGLMSVSGVSDLHARVLRCSKVDDD